ncbi:uncharacterized protein LOC133035975 [Cannabis sativa]|uniref:uncharacterized protein LOC133035975 n=1 Tax=Cannabis sativa TaxID=3483 RepID=UPI0029C9C9DD|nr:uncharacterized protein LOC133035975 [Cannabis sativa]
MKIRDKFGGPWLILGDTNFVLSASEREGSFGRDQFIPVISNLVDSRGLINMPIHGDKMTLDNHRLCTNHVKYVLDKGLVNGAWINLFLRAIICSYQTSNSDHRPLCLFTGGLDANFKRSFKFEEGWTRDARSKLVVVHAWNSVAHPWPPARVFKKIEATRSLLEGTRDWNSERDIRRALNKSFERKALYWKQRAMISWIKDGDKCIKFFFLSAAIRGRRNAI